MGASQQMMIAAKITAASGNTQVITAVGAPDGAFTAAIELGMRFTAASSFTIQKLSRWKVSGDSHAQTVSVYASDGTTLLGSASVDLSAGSTLSWVSASVTPISITSGQQYFVIITFDGSGDHWSNNGQTITTTAVISSTVGATRAAGICTAGSGQTFGPVGFEYS